MIGICLVVSLRVSGGSYLNPVQSCASLKGRNFAKGYYNGRFSQPEYFFARDAYLNEAVFSWKSWLFSSDAWEKLVTNIVGNF